MKVLGWTGVLTAGLLALGGCGSSDPAAAGGAGGSGGQGASGGSGGGTGGVGGSGGTGGAGSGPIGTGGHVAGEITFAATATTVSPDQVYVMKADASAFDVITSGVDDFPTGANDEPSFAPSGDALIFSSGRDFHQSGVGNPTVRLLYTARLDGSSQKRATNNVADDCTEHRGRYSHDGKKIAFIMSCVGIPNGDLGQLFIRDVAGGGQDRPITSASPLFEADHGDPAFTFDDKHVVFTVLDGSPHVEIWSLDTTTKALARVTDLGDRAVSGRPIPSAKGDVIYFASDGGSDSNAEKRFERINLDGTDQKTLFDIPQISAPADLVGIAKYFDFALSPDEAEIVFGAYAKAADDEASTFTVSTAKIDGTGVFARTKPFFDVRDPAWR